MKKFIIVIAYPIDTYTVHSSGKITHMHTAQAVIWSNEGDSKDVKRAKEFIGRPEVQKGIPGAKIYVYPLSEQDPILRAKSEVLAYES